MTVRRADDLEACLALRHAVFVLEQGVPAEIESDAIDREAQHFLAFDGQQPVGTARIYAVNGIGRIGRVCVLASHRGTGLGVALIETGISALRDRGFAEVQLGAQVAAQGFYEGLGFEPFGPVFDSAGIPHRMMRRLL